MHSMEVREFPLPALITNVQAEALERSREVSGYARFQIALQEEVNEVSEGLEIDIKEKLGSVWGDLQEGFSMTLVPDRVLRDICAALG